MHIRFTDNIGSLWNDFGRNANVTRDLHHFMKIAQDIRNKTGISTIYLATDSSTILNAVQDSTYPGWSFVVQQNVIRSSETRWIWFRESRGSSAAAVATDIEVLRRADYLIGSYQSNVYRLVTELNSAFFTSATIHCIWIDTDQSMFHGMKIHEQRENGFSRCNIDFGSSSKCSVKP
jgi:hypothetical protein